MINSEVYRKISSESAQANSRIINVDSGRSVYSLMDQARRKAVKALAGYKFIMFGYWAAIWVHYAKECSPKPASPFREIVQLAKRLDSGRTTPPANKLSGEDPGRRNDNASDPGRRDDNVPQTGGE